MARSTSQRSIHRIRIIRGLINSLETAVEGEEYCIDVLKKSLAIQSALKSLDSLMLEKHLDSCVKGNMKGGKRSVELREELLQLYALSRKSN